MTTSPKTNHAETARGLLDSVHDWQGQEGQTDATMIAVALEAQTVATFALEAQTARLADEARTANLIAFVQLAGDPMTHDSARERDLVIDQIAARLDLTQDVTP